MTRAAAIILVLGLSYWGANAIVAAVDMGRYNDFLKGDMP